MNPPISSPPGAVVYDAALPCVVHGPRSCHRCVERLQPPRGAEAVEEEDAAADEVVLAAVGKEEEVSSRRSEREDGRALQVRSTTEITTKKQIGNALRPAAMARRGNWCSREPGSGASGNVG